MKCVPPIPTVDGEDVKLANWGGSENRGRQNHIDNGLCHSLEFSIRGWKAPGPAVLPLTSHLISPPATRTASAKWICELHVAANPMKPHDGRRTDHARWSIVFPMARPMGPRPLPCTQTSDRSPGAAHAVMTRFVRQVGIMA